MQRYRPCSRYALSLVELLVCLGIVGVLLALILPAVQGSRASARRITCSNHLRHLGVALHTHQAALSVFPRGGDMLHTPGNLPRFHAPHVYLLPYLDQAPLYEQIDLQLVATRNALILPGINDANEPAKHTRLRLFLCPSAPGAANARNHYRANIGVTAFPRYSNVHQRTARRLVAGAFFPVQDALGPQDYPDGLSHTVGWSERMNGDWDEERFTPGSDVFRPSTRESEVVWNSPDGDLEFIDVCSRLRYRDPSHDSKIGEFWFFADFCDTWYSHLLSPNHPIPDCGGSEGGVVTARSAHPAGVNVSMMDGSCRFVSDSIGERTWHAIGTRCAQDDQNLH